MIETPVTPSLRKQPSVTQPTSQKLEAAAVVVLFLLMSVVNYLVTNASTGLIAFTNSEIADTHPVYILPAGYAFSVWGIIYLLEALFVVYQAVPSTYGGGLADEAVASVRALAMALFVANGVWLFLFGWQIFWVALLVIVAYDVLLFKLLATLDVNYFSRSVPWKTKLFVAAGFSANASWVTVASFLQTQVNLLQEGWLPSADFTVGEIALAVAIAAFVVYRSADLVYTLVAAWALAGIAANQAPGSDWGCNSRICAACAEGIALCKQADSSPFGGRPNGWSALCDGWSPTDATVCAVDKSAEVVAAAYVGIAAVAVAFVAGVVRALIARSREAAEAAKQAALAPLAAE